MRKLDRVAAGRGRYHHRNLRAALEDAVLDIVLEHGVDAVTMADAARRAGVSPAAPYRHYDSLDDLLGSASAGCVARFRAAFEDLLAREDAMTGEDMILAAIPAFFEFARREPAAFALMFDNRSLAGSRAISPALRKMLDHLETWAADAVGRSPEECSDLALSISGLVLGQARLLIVDFSPVATVGEAARVAEQGTRLLLSGYRATCAEPKTKRPTDTASPQNSSSELPKPLGRRDELIRIAQQVAARAGLNAFRLADVAEIAGMTAPALYSHFANRDELLEQVIALTMREFVADIESTDDADAPVAGRLRVRLARWTRVSGDQLTVLMEAVQQKDRSRNLRVAVDRARQAWDGFVADVLTRGIARGEVSSDVDLAVATDLLTGCLFGIQLASQSGVVDVPPEVLADHLVDMFVTHVRPRPAVQPDQPLTPGLNHD